VRSSHTDPRATTGPTSPTSHKGPISHNSPGSHTGTVRHRARRTAARSRLRLLVVLVVPIALAVTACGGRSDLPDSRWMGGAGGGSTAAGDGVSTPGASPSPGASPTGSTARRPRLPSDYLARLPKFPPAPRPEPITLPAGPEAAWLSRIPTDQPVAFLTIDDGWVQRPEGLALFRAAHIPVTMFLTINAIRNNPGYFGQLRASGGVIEAHTITHTELKGASYDFQRHEICGSADQLGALYGRRPVLFRPPFGDKDDTTLRVVHDCGLKAAFFWKETVDKGVVRFQQGNKVRPGDIILMHFRPAFVDDFIAALTAIHDAGLTPALLESYLP
jgi:peptidoglycan/xylan/chitin deacetylase (PgdA/CDA1 family)